LLHTLEHTKSANAHRYDCRHLTGIGKLRLLVFVLRSDSESQARLRRRVWVLFNMCAVMLCVMFVTACMQTHTDTHMLPLASTVAWFITHVAGFGCAHILHTCILASKPRGPLELSHPRRSRYERRDDRIESAFTRLTSPTRVSDSFDLLRLKLVQTRHDANGKFRWVVSLPSDELEGSLLYVEYVTNRATHAWPE
jgi:hypothetical protein